MSTSDSGQRPGRKCHCSGNCGPQPTVLSRRQFLELVGVGGVAALAGSQAWAAFELSADELERWRQSLSGPGSVRRYLSDRHTDARLHLGGIGTGNFEIGADGQFTTWLLFNTLRDGQVPFYLLARAGGATRLLQTQGGPDWSRIQRIEMTGEYPFARLGFQDEGLPVRLELTAFSPFVPLDAEVSSLPLVALVFKIHNPTSQSQEVSLAALMQNPVGYEADGPNPTVENPCFGGNINETLREGALTGLLFHARPAPTPSLDRPVTIYALEGFKGLNNPPEDRSSRLSLRLLTDTLAVNELTDPSATVLWLEDAPVAITASFLRDALAAVEAGATLLFSGRVQPLLRAYAAWTQGKPVAQASLRPDILFEDFENGYDKWRGEGEAFGQRPASGTLPNQQRVSGFLGKGLVNTFLRGDDTLGRLISRPFKIERRYIRFLIGGGHYAQTQIRLILDDKAVRERSGHDNERLEPAVWDVADLQGQTAHLEIVDQQTGGWGHINIDQIEFSDALGSREVMLALEQLLPARFNAVRSGQPAQNPSAAEFADFVLLPDAVAESTDLGLQAWSRRRGKGKVVLTGHAVLDPSHATLSSARQRAYALLCGMVGASYTATPGIHPKAPGFGALALVAPSHGATVLTDATELGQAWQAFASTGRFDSPKASASTPTEFGRSVYGAVAQSLVIPAGKTVEVPFFLAWHYPNKYSSNHEWMGCRYSVRWPDVQAVVRETSAHFQEWRKRSELFHGHLYHSSLPYWFLDCLTANAAISRHIGVVFRIANGDVYGWEGSNGCCEPTCTHVWGYEQTFSRLFPDLEKEMRRIDFKHQQRPDGGVNNRTDVPSPPRPTGEQPFADGHASCILKAYREALNHPDETFFEEYWLSVKRAVDYLIQRDADSAGGEPSGVLADEQWNTYDEALHGVTTFISGYYLAALRAGEEWARRRGDTSTAARYARIFQRGQAKLVELCWNGEYFEQHLKDYLSLSGEVGPGCMADQLIGQWWAHQLGLGYILPKDKVVSALRSIYKYNFKTDLTGWKHMPRAFAGAKDKGLVICTWPKGGRPNNVMLYSDEIWTGIEYQVASHMLYEDLMEEGLAIVKAARERYDGVPRPPIPRNPWNEIECGGHYARAMSSWSLLLAVSGWMYDAPRGILRIRPRHNETDFKAFFSAAEGWGSLSQRRDASAQTNEFSVAEGRLRLNQVFLPVRGRAKRVEVTVAGKPHKYSLSSPDEWLQVSFSKPVVLNGGQSLVIRCII